MRPPPCRSRRNLRGGVIFKLLVWLVVLAAAAALAWMLLLPVALTLQIQRRTGFDASIQSLTANPFTGSVKVAGFVLNNPADFPRPEFLQMRAFEIEGEVRSFFSDRLVFDRVVIDVGLLEIVTRADGRTNLQVFQSKRSGPEKQAGGGERSKPRKAVLIRKLEIRFDRFVRADFSGGGEPVLQEKMLHYHRVFENVSDPEGLLQPESLEELAAVGGALAILLPEDVTGMLAEKTKEGGERLREVGRRAEEKIEGFIESLEQSTKP